MSKRHLHCPVSYFFLNEKNKSFWTSILRYLDHDMQTDFYYLMMEYCPDGDLRNQIRQKSNLGEKFDIEQVVEWSLQVASALKFCHDHNVIHRDLKVRTKIVFWSDSFYFSPKTFFLCIKADGQNWQILVLPERQKARPCKPRRMLAPFHTWRLNLCKVRLFFRTDF